ALEDYQGTLLVVSHDRDLLGGLTGKTYEFREGKVKEYLGDVEYFLQKRDEDDMRAVELSTSAVHKKVNDDGPKRFLSYAEKKTLKNKVNSKEREISQLEQKIEKYEEEMMAPDFYENERAGEILKNHQDLQERMEQVLEEWEKLALELEEIG